MDYVLQTNELTKNYGGINVVDKVSLNIKKGEIYGFVGKNGAGKTTFIRLILGLAEATSGSFKLLGDDNVQNARKKTGSLIESPSLYTNMTAYENLDLYCTMLNADKKSIDEILKVVGLSDTGKKKAKDFSLGMKQRLGIAMALVGDPEFIILDEPINGLDPTGIIEIRELILNLKNNYGKTIFISSHILGELEKIATCYGIISRGKLIEEITAEELAEKCGTQTIVQTDNPQKATEIISSMLKNANISFATDGAIILDNKVENIGELTNKLFQSGIVVKGISTQENSAESYFVKKMEGM
ncbi:MAG: ABC transporter ATP-binding protein [Clostridia bacterium]|nr:ABC transporter ATP-binding protein [Clostridia bacterium]